MAKRRTKTIKQIKLEKRLAAIKRQLAREKTRSKKTVAKTRKVFKQTRKRAKQIKRYKPKSRRPLLPRIKIRYRQKRQRKKITRKIYLTKAQKKARYKIVIGKKYNRYQFIKKFGQKKTTRNLHKFRGHLARYYALVRDFQDKQDLKGHKLTKRQAMQHPKFKQLLKDLHRGMLLKQAGDEKAGNRLLLKALKQTTRRDGIPDSIPVGESPK